MQVCHGDIMRFLTFVTVKNNGKWNICSWRTNFNHEIYTTELKALTVKL